MTGRAARAPLPRGRGVLTADQVVGIALRVRREYPDAAEVFNATGMVARLAESTARDVGDEVLTESMVSARDRQPYVVMRWDGGGTQWTPDEARMHANHLLEAAAAAEYDAVLVAELTDPDGMALDLITATSMLAKLRVRRGMA